MVSSTIGEVIAKVIAYATAHLADQSRLHRISP